MIKEAIGKGLTIEEAYEQAKYNLIAELGSLKYNEDDVQFDVIATPKKKTLGLFGGSDAEVKAYIELPDVKPKKEKANKPQKAVKENKPKTERKVEKNTKTETAPVISDAEANAVDSAILEKGTPAANAVAYLKTVLEGLGCTDTVIKVALKDNAADFFLSGEGLGVVIGHRGETLAALQYLVSLAANSAKGYYKITINIGDFRERREKALIGLAKRVSSQVLRTGRKRTLEPMNPYERRIIHTAVQEIKGVTSNSIGEGNSRRVVISPDGERKAYNNDKKNVAEKPVAREPKRDSELPLYGKIN